MCIPTNQPIPIKVLAQTISTKFSTSLTTTVVNPSTVQTMPSQQQYKQLKQLKQQQPKPNSKLNPVFSQQNQQQADLINFVVQKNNNNNSNSKARIIDSKPHQQSPAKVATSVPLCTLSKSQLERVLNFMEKKTTPSSLSSMLNQYASQPLLATTKTTPSSLSSMLNQYASQPLLATTKTTPSSLSSMLNSMQVNLCWQLPKTVSEQLPCTNSTFVQPRVGTQAVQNTSLQCKVSTTSSGITTTLTTTSANTNNLSSKMGSTSSLVSTVSVADSKCYVTASTSRQTPSVTHSTHGQGSISTVDDFLKKITDLTVFLLNNETILVDQCNDDVFSKSSKLISKMEVLTKLLKDRQKEAGDKSTTRGIICISLMFECTVFCLKKYI